MNKPRMLFNLAEDPGEPLDFAAQYPDKFRELHGNIKTPAPEKAAEPKEKAARKLLDPRRRV